MTKRAKTFAYSKAPMPQPIHYRLRREDIQDMIANGTIGQQHFLIRLIAGEMVKEEKAA